jgi:hypothetical protein
MDRKLGRKYFSGKHFSGRPIIKLVFLLIILCVFASFMTLLFYINFVFLDYREIATGVLITERGTGLNANKDSLIFGNNHPGGWGQRSFYVTAHDSSRVRIKIDGSISGMLYISENNFILESGETKRVYVDLNVPEDAALGNYTGRIKIYMLKP